MIFVVSSELFSQWLSWQLAVAASGHMISPQVWDSNLSGPSRSRIVGCNYTPIRELNFSPNINKALSQLRKFSMASSRCSIDAGINAKNQLTILTEGGRIVELGKVSEKGDPESSWIKPRETRYPPRRASQPHFSAEHCLLHAQSFLRHHPSNMIFTVLNLVLKWKRTTSAVPLLELRYTQ